MAMNGTQDDFPCRITVHIPFPTAHLARTALRALAVDEELSPLVKRLFNLTSSFSTANTTTANDTDRSANDNENVLVVHYAATTNRMLRVAINGFFESVGVVVSAMRELDVDVVGEAWLGEGENGEVETEKDRDIRELKRVQGLQEMGPL